MGRVAAARRARLLAIFVRRLREADQESLVIPLIIRAAELGEAELPVVERMITAALPEAAGRRLHGGTIRELGEGWTSGELARRYQDHIRAKRCRRHDAGRLRRYVYPLVGEVAVVDFALDDAERVMATLPTELSASTRRHVAQLIHRLLSLAVFPLRLRPDNPIPPGWLPRPAPAKAKSYLRPDEEAKLLGCAEVPLARRVLYGFLSREGMRRGEALALRWCDLDLERGAVRLDRNKTDDPRAWALGADVAQALRWWQAHLGHPGSDDLVFRVDGELRAETFRRDLRLTGVDRAELYERSKHRQPIRLHDLRAGFITLALANGKSETWVADRTGHRSSTMIHRYRRAARTAAELGLGWLVPMDVGLV